MAQQIEVPKSHPEVAAEGKLRFEGTVELGGAVTSQMLGILFGPDSNVNGKLQFDGPIQIDGTYRGSIKTGDVLTVGPSAAIEADITCGSAVIGGTITGNITARESVTLLAQGCIRGDVTSPSLSVDRGAMFDGVSRMGTLPATKKKGSTS